MKRVYYIFACVCMFPIGMCSPAYAAAPGTTCSTAIPLGDNYSAQITGSKTVWYSAWTFDLPLSVYFIPQNQTDPKPEVEMDFSCTSGVYEDSIICSLFCRNSGSGIQLDMPHRPNLKTGTTADGRFCYYLAIGKEYRDLLLKTGIDYNVEVFVKVTYKSAGVISIAPDDMFTNCMDGPKFMHLGDTVQVKALDKDRHVIVPYVQWQEDSIRYVWDGTAPVTLTIGNECDYDPTDNSNSHILDFVPMTRLKDTLKMTRDEVKYYIHSGEVSSEAGMFFAKFYTTGTGTMKIERVPMAPPQGGATLLRYDKITPIAANNTNALYAIPYTWTTATKFTTPTDHIFKMYIGTTHDFTLENAIATYQFNKNNDGHWLGLTDAQMQALWTQTTEKYLYVRFECTAGTTIKPIEWVDMSECLTNATLINRPSSTITVEKGSYGAAYYRFYYNDWKGGDMKFKWGTNQSTCPTYIGDTCDFKANASNSHVIANKAIAKNGTWTISAEDIAEWEEYVDEDGYLYIRFNPGYAAKMTISTTAPEETDPICNPYDSILSVTAWDSYVWRGTTYTSGGVYSQDGPENAETGCIDTIYTLRLTIHETSYDSYSAAECDSIVYQGITYTQTGTYLDTIVDSRGNRTITTLSLTIPHSVTSEETETECVSFTWHNTTYTQSGSYTDTLTTTTGCDSIVTLHLTINQPSSSEETRTECGSYTWNGQTYSISGNYTFQTTNAAGCDSTATLHLTIHQPSASEETRTECGSYTWNGTTYTQSGNYTFQTINAVGCDSTATLHLTINQPTSGDTTAVACESLTWYGTPLTSSGDYTHMLTNAAGCDSTLTLHLTINQPTSGDTTAVACESFIWYGTPLTNSGNYTHMLTNVAGCDSTLTLHLTINKPSSSEETRSACNSFTWNGTTYTESGNYTFATTNAAGCDSTATLHLTISQPSSSEETKTVCNVLVWNGQTYTSSGNYTFQTTNIAGCDSTVTLHLTVNDCSLNYDTVYFCTGLNTEHEEVLDETLIRRYLPYVYESPAEWNYMEDVIIVSEQDRMQVDLKRAEQNLYEHYQDNLTPIKSIAWSYRPDGETAYIALEVTDEPQWIATGTVVVTVRFVCGQLFTSDFETNVVTVNGDRLEMNGRKVLENGQIVIIRGGLKYSILGTRLE